MPRIIVCSLAKLNVTAAESSASHVLTLMKNVAQVQTPEGVPTPNHRKLDFSDITEPREGEVAPAIEHVEQIIDFVEAWDRARPLIIHCYAGISRSTAGAFIAACHLMPHISEAVHAARIRNLSPTATPNARLVSFADTLLSRNGRMTEAVQAIGRGADCFEGVSFHVDVV